MNYDLEDSHLLVRDTVRQFALEKVAPAAEELDREHRFPYEIVAELAGLGLMGMTIPEEYGGAGTAFFTWGRNDYLSQKGGTGYGVRLIAELATRLSA